ncbi:MAG: exodeoxyribonuclease III [Lentisphaerae bacterium]|nr:exodeoxyribonuclease III [Lentisphaerota bacterium]
MRVATFNANSIRTRLPVVLDWMEKYQPDILCLQETKVQDDSFPQQPIINAGYHLIFRGEKAYNGVCVISKAKPKLVGFGLGEGGSPSDESRLIHVKIGQIHIVNTYVPQGRDIEHVLYQYKLAWYQRLRDYFSSKFTKNSQVIWLGDMNVARDEIDIHNASKQHNHVCFHEDIRKEFEKTIDWGFVDVFRKHKPGPGEYTYYDYRTANAVKREMGWRIDHIFATQTLADKSKDAFIDLEPRKQSKCSDHTFLVADFDV